MKFGTEAEVLLAAEQPGNSSVAPVSVNHSYSGQREGSHQRSISDAPQKQPSAPLDRITLHSADWAGGKSEIKMKIQHHQQASKHTTYHETVSIQDMAIQYL